MKKLFLGLGLLLAAVAATADSPLPLSAFPQSTLEIATPDARLHRFNIWVADNDRLREQGFMFIKHIDDNAGMLFVYSEPHRIAMWMENTLIPLDMLFIRSDGRVVSIAKTATPLSLKTIESTEDVVAALELKGGTAAALNIHKGAIVIHPFFSKTKTR